ncbi:hypothetical protein Hanom_Chr05g00392941 [Helianthus anomalus]
MVCGTFVGNRELAKLRSWLVQLATYAVAFIGGSGGTGRAVMEELVEAILTTSYSRSPITVVLSNVPEAAVEYGLAAIKNLALKEMFLVLKRTIFVWPGAMYIVSVSNGFT